MLTKEQKQILSTALTKQVAASSSPVPIKRVNNYSSTSRKLNQNWVAPRFLNYDINPYRFLNQYERTLVNQYALDLFRSSPLINAAITRKNEWACATGFTPIFKGKDPVWGQLALDYLNDIVLPTCNTAGPNYSWNRTLLTIANQLDIAGDALIVLVPNDSGVRFAIYPSSLVGQRDISLRTLTEGRYRGSGTDNGVIYSTRLEGLPVAYNILQDDPADDFTYSIREAQLIFEPNELCKRGISILASPLLSLLDNQDSTGYVNRNLKNAFKLPIVVNTESGTGEEFVDGPGETTAAVPVTAITQTTLGVNPNIIDYGDYTFFKAGAGEKFEIPNTNNPSTNAVEWIKYVSEECCSALGWPMGLLHPSSFGNTTAGRMVEAQVRRTIEVRQQTLLRIAKLFVSINLSAAMDAGLLPRTTNDDWRNGFTFSLPPEFVIDSYYADQTDLQGLKAGTKTLQEVVSRNGGNWVDTDAQILIENKARIDHAEELLVYSNNKLTFERALDMVGNRGNINAAPLQEQVAEAPVKQGA